MALAAPVSYTHLGSDSNKALAVTCSIKMDTILLGDIATSAKMSIWVER